MRVGSQVVTASSQKEQGFAQNNNVWPAFIFERFNIVTVYESAMRSAQARFLCGKSTLIIV